MTGLRLDNAPCALFLWLTSFGPRFALHIFRIRFTPGSLTQCSVQAKENPLLTFGIPPLLTLKQFSATHVIQKGKRELTTESERESKKERERALKEL